MAKKITYKVIELNEPSQQAKDNFNRLLFEILMKMDMPK